MTQLAHSALLLGLGFVLGGLGGLFGIGGGLFAIPVLGLAFGMNEQLAQGTALVMVVPNVAVGLLRYAQRGRMDRRIALALAVSALPFTIAGAHVATRVPSAPLRFAFALFTLAIAANILLRAFARRRSGDAPKRVLPWPWATLVGAAGGLFSGFFSVGGAIFAVPILSLMFGLTQATAQGFGLALVAPGTLAAIATYAFAGDVDWVSGALLAIGGVIAVPWGVALAFRLPERRLQMGFAALLAVAAIGLFVRA